MTSETATRPRRGAPDADAPDDPTTLSAFVPRLAVELAAAGVPAHHGVSGSMLSADISGFTALSEKLAGKGKAGAEEITDLVNRCFTALIDAAYEYGGEVLKFGGDALLVLFRGDNHERRAVDAGLAMQDALHSSSAAKRANLSMTVGVAGGPFDVFLAGSGYRELLITGPRASEVIRLEGAAGKGDTLVAPELAELLPRRMVIRAESDGFVVTGSTGDPPTGPDARDAPGDLTEFVPPAVREQLAAFARLGGEHRLVTVGFLMVGGVDALLRERGADWVADAFHELVDGVIEVCAAFGVTLLHTDIAPDGVKFILCAGAPVNPGDTSDAMLQGALRIAAIDSPFALRQGVQTGRVFAGFLGSAHRRTYTLMGDPVNTAARMLGKADDRDVVAVESVVEGSRTVFVTDPLEPFLVKGKSEPISAHKVRHASDRIRRDTSGTRLFGREAELALLTHAIGELGEVVVLSGPAGVGKSRLLDAAWDRAEGLRIFQGACTPYGAASPYSVFRPLLRVGSNIPVDADPATAGKLLTELVADLAPELAPMLPLLAVPFGAEVTSTAEADAIDPQFRRARIHDIVVGFLDAALGGPVFLVVEDLHWVDDASGELVNHLVRASEGRPWSGVLTRRPQGAWQPAADAAHVRTIEVAPLTTGDIRTLAIDVSDRPLSDAQLDAVVARAGGNPLFAIELVRAIGRDAGGDGNVPDSIEDLIATRIDGLPPEQRRLIRIASVLGQEFDLAAVDAVSPEYAHLGAELDDMVEHRRGTRYRFRHAMYRDAAYEGLPFRQRQLLHGAVARHLEDGAPDPVSIAPLLSVHYSLAGAREQAWRFGRLAGDVAAAQHAHAEAAVAYRRAIDAARALRTVSSAEREAVLGRLGDTLLTLGDFGGAFDAFARARRLAGSLEQVDLMRRQGQARERQGQLAVAIKWFDRCLARIGPTGGGRRQREIRLQVWLAYAGTRHRQGRFDDCLRYAQFAASEAEQLDDRSGLARANDKLHLASTYLGRDDAHQFAARALGLYREVGDHLSQARVLDNMGIQAYFGYDWDRAVELYADAADAGRIAGDVVEANLARNNAAEVWSDRGRFDHAAAEFDDVLRNWSAAGFTIGILTAAANLALVQSRQGAGEPDTAIGRLAECLDRFRELAADEFIVETTVRLAEAATHAADAGAAFAHVEVGRTLTADPLVSARLDRHEAVALLSVGDRNEAVRLLCRSCDVAAGRGARYETGMSGLVLGHVTADGQRTDLARRELAALGVVELPVAVRRLGCAL